jgi:hypothetical protein
MWRTTYIYQNGVVKVLSLGGLMLVLYRLNNKTERSKRDLYYHNNIYPL